MYDKKWRQSGKVTGIIPGIVLIVFIVFIVAIVSNTPDNSSQVTSTVEQEKERFTLIDSKGEYDGFAFYVTGSIKNNTTKQYSYVQVTFNLYDNTGAQVGTALANVNNLEANGIWKFKAIGMGTVKATKYKLVEITGW